MAGIIGLNVIEINEYIFNRDNVNHWMMYRFANDKDIEVACGGGTGWKEMCSNLPSNEVRYVIMNFSYTSPLDKIERMKRVFLMWAPENAHVKDKIKVTMYSYEAQKLLSQRTNFHITMQGNELSDVKTEVLLEKIRQQSTVF